MNEVIKHIKELENDRVLFVGLKSGKVFFDCHPAEFRVAKAAIKEFRENDKCQDLKEEISKVRYAVRTSKEEVRQLGLDYGLTVMSMNGTFAALEEDNYTVSHIVLTPRLYADIRNFGKTIYDEENSHIALTAGVFGYMWTAKICVDSDLEDCNYALVAVNQRENVLDHDSKEVKTISKNLDNPKVHRYNVYEPEVFIK